MSGTKPEIIAKMIADVSPQLKGTLFFNIGRELNDMGQYYTGSLMIKMAKEYGYPTESPLDDTGENNETL